MRIHPVISLGMVFIFTAMVAACSGGGSVSGPETGKVGDVDEGDAGAEIKGTDTGGVPDAGSKKDTAGSPDIPVDTAKPDIGPDGCWTSDDCKDLAGLGPCQFGVCDVATHSCVVALKSDGTACDDDTACTSDDACKLGQCAGTEKKCDDGDPCTEDNCDAKSGECGKSDVDLCQCEKDADCASEEDGDLCNGTLKCDTSGKANKCVVDPNTVVSCDTSGDSACLKTECGAKSGECVPKPVADGGKCDDGSVCTTTDACAKGLCVGSGQKDCDDKNVCTADSCDPKKGCQHAANKAGCNDGDVCSKSDECVDGKCVGTGGKLDCNDDNPCTDDSCDAQAGCINKANQLDCSDGSDCTEGDKCAGGQCVAGSNKCGCQGDSDCAKFDDGDACNGVLFCDKAALPYICKPKKGSVANCDKSKDTACLKKKCDPKTGGCGLVASSDGAGCDDGNKCTLDDACTKGLCSSNKAPKCDDGNPCTTDSCDKAKGCVSTPATGGCDDGNACTINDKCTASKCAGGGALNCVDGNPCTKDSCDPAKGCQHDAIVGKCSDGDPCTDSDNCVDGKCKGKLVTDCGDGNPCTDDTCDGDKGCLHKNNTAKCDDGSACTAGDACKAGNCVAGKALVCDDKNACTNDSCDPANKAKPCQYKPNTSLCDDNSKCTVIDACKDGKCQGTKPLACTDGEVCTKDTCDAAKGCLFTPVDVKCSDGALCTDKDACKAGKCLGVAKNCDDGNDCTVDSCDLAKGCVNISAGQKCEDGDVCTGNDSCVDGKCKAGKAVPFCCHKDVDCDDSVLCTVDKCTTNVCSNIPPGNELIKADFEGDIKDWKLTTDNKNGVMWQKVTNKAANGKGSLYMGNAAKKDYDGGDTTVTATMPKFKVPMGTVTLSFNVWSDLEDTGDEFDVLSVLVNGSVFDEVFNSTKGWKSVQFDLSPVQGQEVEVAFEFATGDDESNKGEGIYIDNVVVKSATCGGASCKTHKDCSDLNTCTGDLCIAGKCQHSPTPSHTFVHEDFDDVTGAGAAQGWALTSSSKTTLWSISTKRARSGKQSLYVGDPKTSTYGTAKAQAKLPSMRIPNFGTITLVTHVWMDVKDAGCDKDRIRILAGTKNEQLAINCKGTAGKWMMVSADLTKFAGLYVSPIIEFDTVDGTNNGGEGVYIDDVSVVHERACIDLDEDFEDNVPFNFNVTSSSPKVRWHITTHNKYQGIRSLHAADPVSKTYDGGAVTTTVSTGFPVCPGGSLQLRLLTKFAENGCDKDRFKILLGNLQLWQKCATNNTWELVSIDVSKYAGTSIPISFQFIANGTTNKANGAYIDAVSVVCP